MTSAAHTIVDRLHRFVHRHFVIVLIGCYVVAGLFPAPGDWLLTRSDELAGANGALQRVMLAIALFISAWQLGRRNRSSLQENEAEPNIRSPFPRWQRRSWLRWGGLLATILSLRLLWLAAAAMVLLLSGGHAMGLGLLLVLGMPSALSSVPWTDKSRGNVGLALGLILVTLLAAPVFLAISLAVVNGLAPQVARQFGDSITNSWLVAPLTQLLYFSPPVLVGLIVGHWLPRHWTEAVAPIVRPIPTLVILLLNYGYAARVIPSLRTETPWLTMLVAILGVAAAVMAVMLVGNRVSMRLCRRQEDRVALTYSSGMYNTGMAMVLAATWLPGQEQVLVPILLFTLGQHLAAAIVERSMEPTEVTQSSCPRTMATRPVSINEPR